MAQKLQRPAENFNYFRIYGIREGQTCLKRPELPPRCHPQGLRSSHLGLVEYVHLEFQKSLPDQVRATQDTTLGPEVTQSCERGSLIGSQGRDDFLEFTRNVLGICRFHLNGCAQLDSHLVWPGKSSSRLFDLK